jgi:short-subunit dehydrogenase
MLFCNHNLQKFKMTKETAMVTGASSGIGKEMAIELAKKGINLVIVARNESALNELKLEIESKFAVKVWPLALDLSLPENTERLLNFTKTNKIDIDYLINNAGFGDFGFFHESRWEKQEQMINLNILALTRLTHFYLNEMLNRQKGRILNVASVASFQPGPLMSVYYATKAFVLHFSEALNNEVKDSGITVTALCPGPTESGFQKAAALENSKLFNRFKMQDSHSVAVHGIKAMMKGKAIAIPGIGNYLMATLASFFPRSFVVKMIRFVQDKRA